MRNKAPPIVIDIFLLRCIFDSFTGNLAQYVDLGSDGQRSFTNSTENAMKFCCENSMYRDVAAKSASSARNVANTDTYS
jgi:hypothetical protein